MVLPASHGVSRAPRYSGPQPEVQPFRVRGSHPLRRTFPDASTTIELAHSVVPLPWYTLKPTTPSQQRRQAYTDSVWALPLSLATTEGVSDLISFPAGTEMFQFPALAPLRVTQFELCRVSPFGHLRVNARLPAHRSLSQAPTSFIAFWCLGIHHMPLITCSEHRERSIPLRECVLHIHSYARCQRAQVLWTCSQKDR
jgi:hypothetical protein